MRKQEEIRLAENEAEMRRLNLRNCLSYSFEMCKEELERECNLPLCFDIIFYLF